ncbi:MAG: NTP transferase domain-containing protein, partial [Chloroflexota bacterium]
DPVVVVGDDLANEGPAGDRPSSPGIRWRGARRVLNPDPDRGLASSLRLGWAAATKAVPAPEAVLVVLADQPDLPPSILRGLLDAPLDDQRPIVVARFADGGRHPVRLEPAAADLVAMARDDRGLGPLLDESPDRVRFLDFEGSNPDVDSRSDLVTFLADRWAERVRANAAQVARFREEPDGTDFYAKVTRVFVVDPARDDDPILEAIRGQAFPDDTWLDIGAGAGRYALPIARSVKAVIAVDPSPAMLAALASGSKEHGIVSVSTLEGRWPPDGALRVRLGADPVADVALIAHVSYDVAEILPFIVAMERAARRACVAVLMDGSPASSASPFWPAVHGEERIALPALQQFVELLEARGCAPSVVLQPGDARRWQDRDELLGFLRRQLWTVAGSAADARLLAEMEHLTRAASDGSVEVIGVGSQSIGIVTWQPPRNIPEGAPSV